MSDNAEKWISEYAELTKLYGDAIEEGNHKQANKAYDKLMEAGFAISCEEAEKVLFALGEVPNSLLAVSAKITLEEWGKGRLVCSVP